MLKVRKKTKNTLETLSFAFWHDLEKIGPKFMLMLLYFNVIVYFVLTVSVLYCITGDDKIQWLF